MAFEGLRLVREDDSYANLVLPRLLRSHRVSGRDAAFTTELFYGSLRAQGRLDAILAACVDRPLADVDPALVDVLRLGAYQLLDMTVAPHAATSETVALARSQVGAGAASFANAVLRRVGAKTREEWIDEVAPDREKDPTGHLAVVHSHPRWVVRALTDALAGHGRSRDEIDELLAAQNAAPAVSLVMRPGLTDLDELIDNGASAGRLSVFAASWPAGDPGGMDVVKDGRVAVQDEGSQLAALALALGADDLVRGDDAHWLDLCAGPGGKAALLGGLTVGHDADLLAVELQPHRTELVDRSVATRAGGRLRDHDPHRGRHHDRRRDAGPGSPGSSPTSPARARRPATSPRVALAPHPRGHRPASPPCSGRCWAPPWTPRPTGEWSPTSRAPRTSPRHG